MPSCAASIDSSGCAARTAAMAVSCQVHPSRPRQRVGRRCGDRRERCVALAIRVPHAWRCRSPGTRSPVCSGPRDTGVRSRAFADFATALVGTARLPARSRAPRASCLSERIAPSQAYNPHKHRAHGALVQRGLSAAITTAAGFNVRAAADKRYSLGRNNR